MWGFAFERERGFLLSLTSFDKRLLGSWFFSNRLWSKPSCFEITKKPGTTPGVTVCRLFPLGVFLKAKGKTPTGKRPHPGPVSFPFLSCFLFLPSLRKQMERKGKETTKGGKDSPSGFCFQHHCLLTQPLQKVIKIAGKSKKTMLETPDGESFFLSLSIHFQNVKVYGKRPVKSLLLSPGLDRREKRFYRQVGAT